MRRCETCANEYDKAFDITAAGRIAGFDSFRVCIQAMALRGPAVAEKSSPGSQTRCTRLPQLLRHLQSQPHSKAVVTRADPEHNERWKM